MKLFPDSCQRRTALTAQLFDLGPQPFPLLQHLILLGHELEEFVDLTKALIGKAYENGLALLSCGSRGNVIRFLPALNISDVLINEGIDILESCLEELV